MMSSKQAYEEETEKLRNRVLEDERKNHEKLTNLQTKNALLDQQNSFNNNKIQDLEKKIEVSDRNFEEKMNNYKE